MKTKIILFIALSMLAIGCGIKSSSEKKNEGCKDKVCNIQVVGENPVTVSFQTNNFENKSYEINECASNFCLASATLTCQSSSCSTSDSSVIVNTVRNEHDSTITMQFTDMLTVGNASYQID